jgi:hypothetical protein
MQRRVWQGRSLDAIARAIAPSEDAARHGGVLAELMRIYEWSHFYTLRRLRGRQPLWACGVTSFTPAISRPAA